MQTSQGYTHAAIGCSEPSCTSLSTTETRLRSFKPRILIFAASLLFGTFGASADASAANDRTNYDRHYTPSYQRCLDASSGGDFDFRDCTDAETAVQDGRLNQAYIMVMARLSAQRKAELRQLQRAWIRRRDATCEARAADERGGTFWHVVHSGCLLEETVKRRLFLERYR